MGSGTLGSYLKLTRPVGRLASAEDGWIISVVGRRRRVVIGSVIPD